MFETQNDPGLTIYKASAGSGKTFTLAATYIAHLIAGKDSSEKPHRHQLAVTFTNKATAEMKHRILQHLYTLSCAELDALEAGFRSAVRANLIRFYGYDEAHLDDEELRRRAARVLHDIIHDYDHFQVTTIDSFFQRLLAGLAHELGLSRTFKVELEDKEVIAKAVDRLLNSLDENSKELSWITEYVEERIQNDKAWSIAADLRLLGGQIMQEAYMQGKDALHRPMTQASGKEGFELSEDIVKRYKTYLNKLKKETAERVVEAARHADEVIENTLTYGGISKGNQIVGGHLQKVINDPKKAMTAPTDTFVYYADGTKSILTKANASKASMVEMAEVVREALMAYVMAYRNAMFTVNSVDFCIEQLNPLVLLDKIDHEVEKLNKENDRILLASTPLLFDKLASGSEASFVFERAGTQYEHVMIDEFQDTSKLQWSNLRHLLVENMSQGNSCMLVGDVKQGIYRWRGGDWSTLANFSNGYNVDLGTHIYIETLKKNFRSGRRIVEFNNTLFLSLSTVTQDLLNEKWNIEDIEQLGRDMQMKNIYPNPDPDKEVVQQVHHEGGFVRLQFSNTASTSGKKENGTEEERKENYKTNSEYAVEASMAEQMIRLHEAGVPYCDMAILIRTKSDASRLLDYFEVHHGQHSTHPIPLVSEEAFQLQASSAVQTVIHTLRLIISDKDSIAAEFVRQQAPAEHLDEIMAQIEMWQKSHYGGLPFYELATRIISLFQLDKRPSQSSYLYKFLDAILQFIDDNVADIKTFLTYWEESLSKKSIPSAETDGVTIMTIHKSKGLAFHSVFMPYCNWKVEESSSGHKPMVWVTPPCSPYDEIPFLPISLSDKAEDSIFRDVYRPEIFAQYAENLNLVYVAFTRARQNLLVWGDTMDNGENKNRDKNKVPKRNVAWLIHSAIKSAGYEMTTAEDDVVILEIGEPSALDATRKTEPAGIAGLEGFELNNEDVATPNEDTNLSALDSANDINGKPTNPLDFTSKTVRLDFEQSTPRLVFRQSNNARFFLAPTEELDEEARAVVQRQEEYRMRGILLHELMSSIECTDEAEGRIETFVRSGKLPASESENLRHLLAARLSHPLAASWFDGTWTLFRESAIIYRDANGRIVNRRPDRVMVKGNRHIGTEEVVVIDFKFGRHRPEYAEQVQEYMGLLSRQGYTHIRGYLWYLYSGSIEEVVFTTAFCKKK